MDWEGCHKHVRSNPKILKSIGRNLGGYSNILVIQRGKQYTSEESDFVIFLRHGTDKCIPREPDPGPWTLSPKLLLPLRNTYVKHRSKLNCCNLSYYIYKQWYLLAYLYKKKD